MADNIMLSTTVSMNVHPMIRDSKVAKGELKSLNRALKAQSKAFKDTGMDAEGLAEKERLLTKATEAQNKVVEDSKKAYDEVLESIKDKNNMTAKEANAVSRTRGAYEAAKFEMKKYNNEIDKVKANQIQLASGSKELISAQKELELRNTRVVSSYKKIGDETGALRIQYKNLGNEINQNNRILSMEKATLEKLNGVVSKSSTTYKQQEAAVESVIKKHTSLINTQDKVAASLGKIGVNIDRSVDRNHKLTRSVGLVRRGWQGLMGLGSKVSSLINRMGSSFRNIGLVIGSMAIGVLIQNFTTLIPIAASLISVLAGVGGMLVALSGGAIGMAGAFGIAGLAIKLFSAQAKTALKMVEEGEMGASAALTHYKTSLTGLQNQWKDLVRANAGAIFTTMANGINIARYALTTLNPFLTKTANQISVFSGRMKTWFTDSKNMGAVFSMLNRIGPPIFQNILNSLFKVLDGVAHMTVQFAPLFTFMAKRLETMSNGFNKWANSIETDNSIKRFIDYTKTALPLTGDIFGNVFGGIIGLFQAFSGHSIVVMRGMKGVTNTFKEWAQNLSGTQGFKDFIAYLERNGPKVWDVLKNIGSIAVSVIKAMAPIGEFMIDILRPVTEWMAEFAKNHPGFAATLGILTIVIGSIVALVGPIATLWTVLGPVIGLIMTGLGALATAMGLPVLAVVGIIAGIAALIGALAWLNTKIKPVEWGPIFSKLGSTMANAWNGMLNWFKSLWASFTAWLPTLGASLSGAWGFVWNGLISVVRNAMNGVLNIIRWLFNTALGIFSWLGGVLKATWGLIWGGIKNLAVWYMTNLMNSLKIIWGGIVSFAKWIFGGLKTFFSWIWNGISSAVMWAVRGIGNLIRSIFGGINTFIRWIWGGIASFFTWIWNSKIGGAFRWGLQAINVVVRIVFAAIGKFIRWIFNGIASFIKWVWNGIKTSVMFYVNLIKRLVTAAWNILSRVTRAIFNAIKNFLIAVWTVIKNRVVGLARGLWNIVRGIWNILSSTTRKIFNSVKNFMIWVWNNIRARVVVVVRLLWKNITTVWNAIASTTRRIFNYIKNWVIWLWNNIRNRVVAVARALWKSISGVWNAIASTTRKVFNYIRNWLVWLWNSIKNKVVSIARSLWNTVRGIWNAIASGTRKVFNSIRSFLTWLWTVIRNKVTSVVRSLWNGVRGTWNNLTNGTKRIFNGVRNYLVDKWNGIKNSVTGVASDLWASVKQTFTNMKNGLGTLADKIGGVITGMVKGIKKGLNSLIKGVNWVAKKLGVDQKIPELSTGTGGASHTGGVGMVPGAGVSGGAVSSAGYALVNDKGNGNGSGPGGHQEVIQRANGTMVAPKGRDVTVPLGKGDVVHSGKAVQRAQKAGMFPKFSTGTNKKKKYDLLKDMKKNKNKGHHTDDINGSFFGPSGGGVLRDLGKMKDAAVGTGKEHGKKAAVGTTKKAADGTKKLSEGAAKAGKMASDLLDYVGNPGKLVDLMMGKFNVDFGKIKGQIPKDMMWDPMWKGLKGGVKSLFDGWLTEADGAGDGGYIDLSKGINYGFGHPPGYPFGRHDGLDINYPSGSKLYSTLAGTANGITPDGSGFGNHMWINNGKGIEAIYGHMSKLAWKGKKKVKPGTYLGKSGGGLNDPGRGKSTGAHLHYEMRWNGKPRDPTKWLKENNGGGGSKSASKWKGDIKKAAKATGVSLSGGKLNDIVKLIATESNGNPKVKQQVQDINSGSNAARGLLQYTPGTFKGYATKNGKNILNGMHQLKAFFNNSNWSSDLAAWKSRMARGSTGWGPTGGRRGYAKGTDSARSGIANVFEKGGEIMNLRGGEQIIPNDVSINALKSMMSSDLFSRTQSAVYAGISRYAEALEQKQEQKRIKELKAQQQANANTTDINELKSMMADMVYLMQQQLGVQENIAGTNNVIANKSNVIDVEKTTQKVSEQEAFNLMMSRYSSGLKMD